MIYYAFCCCISYLDRPRIKKKIIHKRMDFLELICCIKVTMFLQMNNENEKKKCTKKRVDADVNGDVKLI